MRSIDDIQNPAIKPLAQLIGRATHIIDSIFELEKQVPSVFELADKETQKAYGNYLLDFKYIVQREYFDSEMEKNLNCSNLDKEFRNRYLPTLRRFWLLFQSIYQYLVDFNQHIKSIEEGEYSQYTLETTFEDPAECQILCGSLYMCGVTLMILEKQIPGILRERLLVCYIRLADRHETMMMNQICFLCARIEPNHGESAGRITSYFSRLPCSARFVKLALTTLWRNDFYSQYSIYVYPEHQHLSFGAQAAITYICLYFSADTLDQDFGLMGKIVQKFFHNNWVVPWYLGFTADLTIEWKPYKAAMSVLNNFNNPKDIASFAAERSSELQPFLFQLSQQLQSNVLTEPYILKNYQSFLLFLCECNSTLRWCILHFCRAKNRKLISTLLPHKNMPLLIEFLTRLSQAESTFKCQFQALIRNRGSSWDRCKTLILKHLRQIKAYCSAESAADPTFQNHRLSWLSTSLPEIINQFDVSSENNSFRKIQAAFDKMAQFHQLDPDPNIHEILKKCGNLVKVMYSTYTLKPSFLDSIAHITNGMYMLDLSFDLLIPVLQECIRTDSDFSDKLQSLFNKLMVLPFPTFSCYSPPASSYGSAQFASFVLQVTSSISFNVFSTIKKFLHPPYAAISWATHYEELCQSASQISALSSGLYSLNRSISWSKLDLLSQNASHIRALLSSEIENTLQHAYSFTNAKPNTVSLQLTNLSSYLQKLKFLFQLICEHSLSISYNMWYEELSKLVETALQTECNFIQNLNLDKDMPALPSALLSNFLSFFKKTTDSPRSFLGKVAYSLIQLTLPSQCIYIGAASSWYDMSSSKETLSPRTFSLLLDTFGTSGLLGFDRLYTHLILHDLGTFSKHLHSLLDSDPAIVSFLADMDSKLNNSSANSASSSSKSYKSPNSKSKLHKTSMSLYDLLCSIGQKQLLRLQLSNLLQISARIDLPLLFATFQSLNSSFIDDIHTHFSLPHSFSYPDTAQNTYTQFITSYLERVGLYSPLHQRLTSVPPTDRIILILLSVTLEHLSRNKSKQMPTQLQAHSSSLHIPLVFGMWTVLNQLHTSMAYQFLRYLRLWVNFVPFDTDKIEKSHTTPYRTLNSTHSFLEQFARISDLLQYHTV